MIVYVYLLIRLWVCSKTGVFELSRTDLKLISWCNSAKEVSKLSTCKYTKVGAVLLTEDFKIISTGYNGVISGATHCCDIDHVDRDAHGVFADKFEIHAEMNALLQVTEPSRLKNSICFSTLQPCYNCMKHLVQSGVKHFYFMEAYWRIDRKSYLMDAREAFPDISITQVHICKSFENLPERIDKDIWKDEERIFISEKIRLV